MTQRKRISCFLLLVLAAALTPGSLAQTAAPERNGKDRVQALGDLDRDGDVDLIVVREQAAATEAPHVLYVNTNGVLVDRTADLAAGAEDDTATVKRQVRVADMNNDGWLDLISSAAPGPDGDSGIGYPWVYLNQCCAVGGCQATSCSTDDWLGLRFENDRIPEMLSGGKPSR